MRSSALSKILVLLICSACASIRPSGITRTGHGAQDYLKQDSTVSSPFRGTVSKAIFRCSMDVRGHHMTGLLYLKRMPDSTMRIAFTNEFGMTWFDFILKNDQITVAYCFDPMNKKALHRILSTNFELLFSACSYLKDSEFYSETETGKTIIKGRFHRYRTWYTLENPSCRVGKISGKSGFPDKTLITFSGYHEGVPDSAVIVTPVIHMVMKLTRER